MQLKFFNRFLLIFLFCSFHITINAQVADIVLKTAKIYVGNTTFVEALAISGGKIIYTGTDAGVAVHIGAGTCVKDLGGKLVLPGLHDVHMHPLEASSSAGGVCALSKSETNPENFVQVLKDCSMVVNSNGWKMASGHAISTLLSATRDPKLILDDVSTTEKIIVLEQTSHSVWVNSKVLTELGITASTPDPIGGHIVKNASGQPNGILLDNAGDNLLQLALAQNATVNTANYNGLVNYGLPLIAQNGITSISEARTYWKRNYIPIWQQIKTDNKLTCRVGLAPWLYPSDDDATQITAIKALYSAGDDLLKIRQIKVYSDGIITTATAALSAPYNNNLGFPFTNGLNYFTQARLANYIQQLELTGYDFHIHAIGDRGITESLNAIGTARTTNGDIGARHRVTHVEMVNPTDYPRFSALNVVADMQVSGDFAQPSHWNDHSSLIGTRGQNAIPLKSLFDNGAKITLSSDWDVSNVNPFIGMQNALTRAPQELPSVEEVVKAYTINGAYVMRQEAKTGSLVVGKYADLIVVDKDIFTIATNTINTTKVLLTLLEGKQVFPVPVAGATCVTLPIKLIDFTATISDNNDVLLKWSTATEYNNSHFEVERSTDAVNFTHIATINGNKNTVSIVNYNHIDHTAPLTRICYYRLKQIDFDGKFEYSKMVAVKKNTFSELNIFPNPVISDLLITEIAENAVVEIYDKVGQLVKTIDFFKSGTRINVSDLPAGIYFIKLISNNYLENAKTAKFVKE